MASHKHKNPPQAPLVFNATPESMIADNQKACDRTKALLDHLVATVSPGEATFANVVGPIAHDESERSAVTSVLGMYQKVSADPAMRQAAAEAEKTRAHFLIDCGMREDVFRLVDAAFQRGEELDTESRKFLSEERRSYIRNGLALAQASDRERLKEIQKRLSTIGMEFIQGIDEEESGVWLTRDELRGVPEDVLGSLVPGEGAEEGKLRVTFKNPDYQPVMRYAKSEATREKAFRGMESSCSKNIPLFEEAIRLRSEAAAILGYQNHAAYKLEIRMAKTPDAVMAFLEDVRDRALRLRDGKIEEMLSLKQSETKGDGSIGGDFCVWDRAYYTRLLKEKRYSVDQMKVAEYFPLGPTVDAMLKLFGELFGFVFVELNEKEDRARLSPMGKAEDLTWHEDVILYSVWNEEEGGEFAGYLYMDLHPRPGKYGNAQCPGLQLGFTRADGQRVYPSTALIANFTKPTADKPSLLKHNEMLMLFHELGHGMHDLSGRCKYSRYHGAETVGDFVEAPSQMLESWCWEPQGLRSLSSHYETGEPMPDEMIEALVRTKHVSAAVDVLEQIRFCMFDMATHSIRQQDAGIDLGKLYADLRTEITGMEAPEGR